MTRHKWASAVLIKGAGVAVLLEPLLRAAFIASIFDATAGKS